ncbi:MAG: class I SAM-dependent methyltransferase [Candidatus Hermodarchaeota archaeon]
MTDEAQYLSDKEYRTIFQTFCSFRKIITSLLIDFGLLKSHKILDLAAGHGFMSFTIREFGYKNEIYPIGLTNDLHSFKQVINRIYPSSMNIQYLVMDTTKLGFENDSIDFIVNFLGLEDINMTRGYTGVCQSLSEACRVLRKGGILEIAILQRGSEPSDDLNWRLWESIGLNAIFHPPESYIQNIEEKGLKIQKKVLLKSSRKMTAKQAREEILFACEKAPQIFKEFNVHVRAFDDVWAEFGSEIGQYGLGFYPNILVLIFKKI